MEAGKIVVLDHYVLAFLSANLLSVFRITSGGAHNIGFCYGLGALIMLKKCLLVNP